MGGPHTGATGYITTGAGGGHGGAGATTTGGYQATGTPKVKLTLTPARAGRATATKATVATVISVLVFIPPFDGGRAEVFERGRLI